MQTQSSWTVSLGRWSGVPFRVHLTFLLFAALVFCIEWFQVREGGVAGTAAATLILVFFMALFHELCHAFAAVHLGGRLEEIQVTPWGGLSAIALPSHPKQQLLVHAAGPFLNLVLFTIGAGILTITRPETGLLSLIHPLQPRTVVNGLTTITLLEIATWVNFQMLVVNLLPVFPFDASQIMRTSVLARRPQVARHQLENALMAVGIAVGFSLLLAAWFLRGDMSGVPPLQPTWFLLVCLGLTLVFSARYAFEREVTASDAADRQSAGDYADFESFYEDEDDYLEEYEEELYSDWLSDHHSVSENIERSVEQEEDRRVDSILDKLHQRGIEGLTEEERSFLNRISLRYRRRRQLRS